MYDGTPVNYYTEMDKNAAKETFDKRHKAVL